MDPKMDELLEVSKDTNRMVHKMRRGQLWGRFYQVVWWAAVVAVSGAAYYLYAQPYLVKIEQTYTQVQLEGQKIQGIPGQVSNFFANWLPHSATTSTATTTH